MNTFDPRSFKRGPLAYCYDIGFTRLEAIGSDVIIVDDARSAFPPSPPPPDGETIQHRPPLSFTQRVLSRNVKRYSPRWPIFFLPLFRPFPPPFFLFLFFPISLFFPRRKGENRCALSRIIKRSEVSRITDVIRETLIFLFF